MDLYRVMGPVALVLTSMFLISPIHTGAVVGLVREEQSWTITINTSDLGRFIVVAHVSLEETIHPAPGQPWPKIGPIRMRGNITNVQAIETKTGSQLDAQKTTSLSGISNITIIFSTPQRLDPYKVTLSFDWSFMINSGSAPFAMDRLRGFVFRWDALSVTQLQTDGQILCCVVPQDFKIILPSDFVFTSLTHGVLPIPHTVRELANVSSLEFSTVVPKGFLSATGVPIPRVVEWWLRLAPRRILIWLLSPERGQNVSGMSQVFALASSATPVNESNLRIDEGPWIGLNVSDNVITGFWNTTELPNGEHTVSVSAQNQAGMSVTVTVPVVVNNTRPQAERAMMFRFDYLVPALIFSLAFLAISSALMRKRKGRALR